MSELIFKPVPYDVVTSATTGQTTVRSTDANAPYNSKLLYRLQALAGGKEYDGNMFDDDFNFDSIDILRLQKLLTQIVIRFDNNPKYYLKEDYMHLIWYLCLHLAYLTDTTSGSSGDILDLKEQLNNIVERITSVETDAPELKAEVQTALDSVNNLSASVEQQFTEVNTGIVNTNAEVSAIKQQNAKKIWTTYSELEKYVLDPNDSAAVGMLLTVTDDGANSGAYFVKSINREATPAEAEIIRLATGECRMVLAETVSPEIAYVTDDGKLHIEDMRTYWSEKSFQD